MNDDTNEYEAKIDALAAHFVRDLCAPGRAIAPNDLLADYLSTFFSAVQDCAAGAQIGADSRAQLDYLISVYIV